MHRKQETTLLAKDAMSLSGRAKMVEKMSSKPKFSSQNHVAMTRSDSYGNLENCKTSLENITLCRAW